MAQLSSTNIYGALSVSGNISEGGSLLSAKYLGISAKAASAVYADSAGAGWPTTVSSYTNDAGYLTSHQTVTDKDATLAWSTQKTVATIGSTDIHVTLPANPNSDTKNTAGTTNKTATKMYLVAATSQGDNPQTYSNSNCYIGTDNCLYSGGTKVLTSHQSVTNGGNTASWGNSCTVGTVGSTNLTFTMPANPNTDTYPSSLSVSSVSGSNTPVITLGRAGNTTTSLTANIPLATTSVNGVVSTIAQTFAGVKTFQDGCYGALWNDLADCIPVQSGLIPEAGYCYSFNGTEYGKTSHYLDKNFIGICSDTYGFAMGKEENKVKLDIAVAGFVLAHTDKNYKPGTPLTCTKNGELTKIKFFDKIFHPDMIIATYWKDEPNETFGSKYKKVVVNNRNWVKVR